MKGIEKAITSLEQAFDEFKHQQETRLDSIEAQHARPQLETKENSMNSQDLNHKSAFINYLTKGEETEIQSYERKSLSAGIDKDGGYFLPKMISLKIQDELKNFSLMRSIANNITISTDAVEFLIDKKGAAVGWAGELQAHNETDTPELTNIKIPTHELYARPRVTKKLLDDAHINVEQWLIDRISKKIAQAENYAFFKGDGKNMPKGFLTYPSVNKLEWEWGKIESIATGANGAFNEGKGADTLIECVNALKPQYLSEAMWIMSRSAHSEIRRLKDKMGNYLWQMGIGEKLHPTLLGYPVMISDDMPEFNDKEGTPPIAFGNFRQGYQIVDREAMNVLRDPYSAKPFIEFYTTARVGGDVVDFEAIKTIQFIE